MSTNNKKEQPLTLLEFNEERQEFNLGEQGAYKPREGWMPIAWMTHDVAAKWGSSIKAIKDRRILTSREAKVTLAEVVAAVNDGMYDAGFAKGMEMNDFPEQVYLVCENCDEGGVDISAAFTDELTAYHYMDCEGGDCVQEVTLRHKYENHQRRTYFIVMDEGCYYHDVKQYIGTTDGPKHFKEQHVRQAVHLSRTKEGRLRIEAFLMGSHRYQIFKTAEKLIYALEFGEDKMNKWFDYPSLRPLTVRELTPFEREIADLMYFGQEPDASKPLMGIMGRLIDE